MYVLYRVIDARLRDSRNEAEDKLKGIHPINSVTSLPKEEENKQQQDEDEEQEQKQNETKEDEESKKNCLGNIDESCKKEKENDDEEVSERERSVSVASPREKNRDRFFSDESMLESNFSEEFSSMWESSENDDEKEEGRFRFSSDDLFEGHSLSSSIVSQPKQQQQQGQDAEEGKGEMGEENRKKRSASESSGKVRRESMFSYLSSDDVYDKYEISSEEESEGYLEGSLSSDS